jgi:hypothetical protein
VFIEQSSGTIEISLYATYMRAVDGLYSVEYNTEMLKRRSIMKHCFSMSSIKSVSHELVLKVDNLTAATLISLQHVLLVV